MSTFITTSLPYVNGAPHIGHALEFVQADTFARFQRLVGQDTRFLSGTDDNSLSNVLAAHQAGIPVVAVDIPSGIDVQTGAADGAHVHATLTVTFGGLKPVHALGDCGRVELVDIGLDLPATDMLGFDAADVAARWPKPGPTDDKYTQGVTGILAGSVA